MLEVLTCPSCGERINVDLVREFTKIRCQKCGKLLERALAIKEKNEPSP